MKTTNRNYAELIEYAFIGSFYVLIAFLLLIGIGH